MFSLAMSGSGNLALGMSLLQSALSNAPSQNIPPITSSWGNSLVNDTFQRANNNPTGNFQPFAPTGIPANNLINSMPSGSQVPVNVNISDADLKKDMNYNGKFVAALGPNLNNLTLNSTQSKQIERLQGIMNNPQIMSRIQPVAQSLGVPATFILGILEREGTVNEQIFDKYPHNGDPMKNSSGQPIATVNVPAGKKFNTWEEAAIDAFSEIKPAIDKMRQAGIDFSKNTPESITAMAALAERYNGLGYRGKGDGVSPYAWGGTPAYQRGHYVADGDYDENAVDQRLGVVATHLSLSGSGGGVMQTPNYMAQNAPVQTIGGTAPQPQPQPPVSIDQIKISLPDYNESSGLVMP